MSDGRPSFSKALPTFSSPKEARNRDISLTPSPINDRTPLLGDNRSPPYTSKLSARASNSTFGCAVTPHAPRVSKPASMSRQLGKLGNRGATLASSSTPNMPSLNARRSDAVASTTRPSLLRAATATVASPHPTSVTPLRPRPVLPATTTTAPRPLLHHAVTAANATRPSLLRRATDIVQSTLDLSLQDTYAHRNAPSTPSHWTDHAHRKALVRIWDAVHAEAVTSRHPQSTTAQLFSTESHMLREYAELAEGDVPLTRAWLEHVLGLCLRHPFCTTGSMGRYEVLSASGGARGNWGPW